MILSFRHRFIFVAVPRTATHTLRRLLRPHLAPTDWEQCLLHGERAFPVEALARIRHGHIALRDLPPFLLPGMWESFFRFGFVRDPLDRFRSASAFYFARDPGFRKDPLTVMKGLLERPLEEQHVLFRPQHLLLATADGRLLTNWIGRYERLSEDARFLLDRLGFADTALPHCNASPRAEALEACFDEALLQAVAAYYRDDYALFGYPSPV